MLHLIRDMVLNRAV